MKTKAKWKKLREATGTPGVYRLVLEHQETGEQRKNFEKKYEACRWIFDGAIRKKVSKCFADYSEARAFVRGVAPSPAAAMNPVEPSAIDIRRQKVPLKAPKTFRELVELYIEKELPTLSRASRRTRLAQMQKLKFFMRKSVWVADVDPDLIDRWIKRIKDPRFLRCQHATRVSYFLELKLLRILLTFYRENYDYTYPMPILKRHRKSIVVRQVEKAAKDLRPFEHAAWTAEIGRMAAAAKSPGMRRIGLAVQAIARLQYPLFARICEVAALRVQDVNRETGEVTIRRHLDWDRIAGGDIYVVEGLKASDVKVVYSPLACRLILEYAFANGIRSGFLFQPGGEFVSYRQIQYRYDKAFKKLGMQKSGTHVVRHGAGSEFDELNGGNLKLTARALGHSRTSTTEGYVRVRDTALQDQMARMDERLQSLTH